MLDGRRVDVVEPKPFRRRRGGVDAQDHGRKAGVGYDAQFAVELLLQPLDLVRNGGEHPVFNCNFDFVNLNNQN